MKVLLQYIHTHYLKLTVHSQYVVFLINEEVIIKKQDKHSIVIYSRLVTLLCKLKLQCLDC